MLGDGGILLPSAVTGSYRHKPCALYPGIKVINVAGGKRKMAITREI